MENQWGANGFSPINIRLMGLLIDTK